MSLPFHRKYRPSKFDELDQKSVREYFLRVLESGKLSQAYLFSGPKGTGKTSAARLLAMCVNCEGNAGLQKQESAKAPKQKTKLNWKLKEPCGECESCVAIRKSSSTAVVEIDAASNRGIDDIRALRERVNLIAGDGKYSVYIIDEVHMLTTEAFNALLKTLEEPPAHVIFCLCTTEEHKVPGTIVSRCSKVVYQLSTDEEIVRSLKRVVEGENIKISDEALMMLVQRAEGSFRDASVALAAIADSEMEITAEIVAQRLGETSSSEVDGLIDVLVVGDGKEALSRLEQLEKMGVNTQVLAKQLLARVATRIKEQVRGEGSVDSELMVLVEMLAKTFSRFADVPDAAIALEMAVVEVCLRVGGGGREGGKIGKSKSSNDGAALRQSGTSHGSRSAQDDKTDLKSVSVLSSQDVGIIKPNGKKVEAEKQEGEEAQKQKGIEVESHKDTESQSSKAIAQEIQLDDEVVRANWGNLLNKVSEYNHGLVTLLRRAEYKGCSKNELVLAVGYAFHKEQLQQDRYLRAIEEAGESVWGVKIRLRIELGESNGKVETKEVVEHENISGALPKEEEQFVQAVEEVFGV